MEPLSWIQDPERIALGWTLLHFCWQGAAIALLYAVADRLAARSSANLRYGLAVAALALMPLAALATFIEQAHLIVHLPSGTHPVVASQLGAMHTAFIRDVPAAAPAVATGELWLASHTSHWLPWLDGLWLAGVLLLALRALGGWWQLERLRRRARSAVPPAVAASFQHVSAQLRLGRQVALRISDEVISPLAMGVWHAAVILPASVILQLAPEQLEAVLAHELAHIRRLDFLCNLLQTTVECLLFFHPAIWWISHRTRDLREICCDEVAARSCDDPVIYAEALLQLEETRTQNLHLAMALKGRNGNLLLRIRQILGEGINMERTSTSGLRVVVLTAVVLAVLFGSRAASGLKLAHLAVATGVPAHARILPQPASEPTPVPAPIASRPAPITPVNNAQAEPSTTPQPEPPAAAQQENSSGADYIQQMKDAGYDIDLSRDLDQVISMRSVGVTPTYARQMQQFGLGKPSLHDLVSMRAVGVTPEYIAQLEAAGIAPKDLHDVTSMRAVGVTPDYVKSITALGLGAPDAHDITSLRAVGVTPDYIAELKAQGLAPKDLHQLSSMRAVGVTPDYAKQIASLGMGTPDMQELISLRAQGITPEYAQQMKAAGMALRDLRQLGNMKAVGVTPEFAQTLASAGYPSLNTRELINLRAQGVTPEYARWFKQTFPTADEHGLSQAAVFHIDNDFIAKAKSHGFNDTSLDKLLRLKMSGLLD